MNSRRTYIIRLSLALLLIQSASCVDPFQPEISEKQEVMVINGLVVDGPGPQQVLVSRASPYNEPSFNPVEGCVVSVMNERGEVLTCGEAAPGIYEFTPTAGFIAVGSSYSVRVNTPGGAEYRSDYDSLLACPPIDSVYYEQEIIEGADPTEIHHGLQFYVDVAGSTEKTRNYRWIIDETWAYSAPYMPLFIYDGRSVEFFLTDSIYRCYKDTRVEDLFTGTASRLSVKMLNRNPLHLVTDETPRLKAVYEVRVRQHSLSNAGYDFWTAMKSHSSGGGGLYVTQPASILGNVYNVNDPEEKVLGNFYAAQERSCNLIIPNDFDFDVMGYSCDLDTIPDVWVLKDDYPYYLISINPLGIGPPYLTGPRHCFDCRAYGGSTTKPEYW